ncbi:MAG: hypothetical protein ACRDSE_13610 [Pseudonocardiaceae bacterium]
MTRTAGRSWDAASVGAIEGVADLIVFASVSSDERVLREAELVVASVAGTRHLYRINPKGLAIVRAARAFHRRRGHR